MYEINAIFRYNNQAQNGAIARLWKSSGFSAPPAQDDDEPGLSYKQGSDVITGVNHGCDGAFRFVNVPAGDYYVSVNYDGHRAWLYIGEVDIHTILTNDEDMLIRRGGLLTRLPIDTNGKKFTIVSGQIKWV